MLALAVVGRRSLCLRASLLAGGLALLAATAEAAPLHVEAEAEGLATVNVRWPSVRGARSIRVFLGAEPGAQPDGAMPHELLIAKPPAGARSVRVAGLAPLVDCFVRVEIRGADGTTLGTAHARTVGGPRAHLDNAAREVHLVAPDILEIVIAGGVGSDGSAWTAPRWQVQRASGARIPVLAVHRQSIPVGHVPNPASPRERFSDLVVADHRVYLRLAEAVGSPELLRVAYTPAPPGPMASMAATRSPASLATPLEMRVPVSDRYLETPSIQLNQVGYAPQGRARYAYVSNWLGDGGPMKLDQFPAEAEVLRMKEVAGLPVGEHLLSAPLRRRAEADPDAGTAVDEIDLAPLPADPEAVYRIRVPGVGVSYPTRVSDSAVLRSFYIVARGLYHNRWGADLRPQFTDWPRPVDHPFVYTDDQPNPFAMHPATTPKVGKRPLAGGYHDAGDFDQRPQHTVVAELLLRAFDLRTVAFPDRQLTLPESGNGIPDFLDEALWGVRAWEQLQEEDGGVRGGVESHRHPLMVFASEDPLPYWTFGRDPQVSARAAGVFAMASRLVQPYDAARAKSLRARALSAYAWAKAHGGAPCFLLLGASELSLLTGEAGWRTEVERVWKELGPKPVQRFAWSLLEQSDYSKPLRPQLHYLLGYLRTGLADKTIQADYMAWLDTVSNNAARAILESKLAHRTARPVDHATGWGHGIVAGQYQDSMLVRMALPLDASRRARFIDALSLGVDYLLGGNPDGVSYVVGLGARTPLEPLHCDSNAWIAEGKPPVPGIPVYGPFDAMPGAAYYKPAAALMYPPFAQLPRMRRWADVRTFINGNEFSVWEVSAPHIAVLAALVPDGALPPKDWLPRAARR